MLLSTLALALEPGEPLPDFSLPDLAGAPVGPADLRGSPVVLNVWATWCRPCLAELPLLEASLPQHPGWRFVAISLDPDPAPAQAWAQAHVPSLTTLYDPKGGVFDSFGLVAVPATYLVDREGVVRWARIGALSLESLPELERAMRKLR